MGTQISVSQSLLEKAGCKCTVKSHMVYMGTREDGDCEDVYESIQNLEVTFPNGNCYTSYLKNKLYLDANTWGTQRALILADLADVGIGYDESGKEGYYFNS